MSQEAGRSRSEPKLRPNQARLVALLGRSGGMSRAELAAALTLPKPTVAGLAADLVRRGIVVEREPALAPGKAGRPPKLLALSGPARAIAILNWSAGKLQAAVADYGGTILALRAIEVSDKQAEAGVLDPGLELLAQALADAGLGPERLAAAVMGVPAPFRSGVGLARVKVAAPGMEGRSDLSQYYPLWLRTDPAIELSRQLGAPAVVENDANLGALGEAAFGAASEIDSFVYVKFGEGVGAGIVLDGRLHRGSTGFAGELAHVQVRDDGPLCACGGRGCLSGLLKTALTEVVDAAESAPLTFADLLARAEQGDGGSRRILRDLGRTIGRPLADLCTVLNPAAVIVDGALGPAGGHVVSGVRETIDRFAAPAAADAVQIALGTLGERADIYGGVALARDEAAFPSTSR